MKRQFTREEDEMIVQQSRGELQISINTMEIRLRTSRETLFRRAEELGVTLALGRRSVHKETCDESPYRIKDDDKLLKRLQQYHSNRMENKDGETTSE
jgi:hypothetical protein